VLHVGRGVNERSRGYEVAIQKFPNGRLERNRLDHNLAISVRKYQRKTLKAEIADWHAASAVLAFGK
jgi:hypothetical protein